MSKIQGDPNARSRIPLRLAVLWYDQPPRLSRYALPAYDHLQ